MIKTLVIINEPFEEMVVGKNTTLSYILGCSELDFEIYIYNLPKTGDSFPSSLNQEVTLLCLSAKHGEILARNYRKFNGQIKNLVDEKKYHELQNLTPPRVLDILGKDFLTEKKLILSEINFILQRIEPMKAPFPPEGNKNVRQTLAQIKQIFPHHIFNCPIEKKSDGSFVELEDKETPRIINQIINQDIATPTAEFRLHNPDFFQAISLMKQKYSEIFAAKKTKKIVIKPKNSAQSLGVFALEFIGSGLDLKTVKSISVAKLAQGQIYKISDELDQEELRQIIEILCYVQRVKGSDNLLEKLGKRLIDEINPNQIVEGAAELYTAEILAQPFLEGIKDGDIRANFSKDAAGNFYLAGCTFRNSAREESVDDFTTCYTSGGAVSKPIFVLSPQYKSALLEKCAVILRVLNAELREKYQNSVELGADFILVGDEKSVMLGEINHHCPALLPISEAMAGKENYDGGLGYAKRAIRDGLKLQSVL